MKKLMLITCLLVSACSDPDNARRHLEDAGYTNIEITGYRWTGCGQGDDYQTGFRAKGLNGRPIEGVVCSGWGWFSKGSTIRLD